MHGTTENKRGLRAAFRSLLGALLASSPGIASSVSAADEPPLVLAKTSYFFVGGKIDPAVEGSPMVGHMYVEYMIPQRLRHRYPIVMVHGGSQTGTNFTGTPDGREGWAQYFVRRGYAVYVVDQVARGRSAHWSQSQGKVADGNLGRTEQRFVAPERFKLWPQAHFAHAMAGRRQAGRCRLRPVLCLAISLARRFRQAAADQPAGARRAARQDRPGDPAHAFAVRRLRLAGRRCAAESGEGQHRGRAERPAGPTSSTSRARRTGSPTIRKRRFRAWARCRSPTTRRSPAAPSSNSSARTSPTSPNSRAAGCRRSRRASSPNVAKVPILIVTSEASYHAGYDHCTAAYLTQAGVKNTLIRLADVGIHGNGHMMMLEKNSDDIARVAGVTKERVCQIRLGLPLGLHPYPKTGRPGFAFFFLWGGFFC